jgi:hypothetical protein
MTSIQKISTIILTVIAGLSLIFAGFYFLGGTVEGTEGTPIEEKNFTSLVLVWAVIVFIIAALSTLIYSLINIVTNAKALRGFLIGLGIGAVLVAISYLISSSAPLSLPDAIDVPSEAQLKWVGTGLNATYILAVVAFVGIIASEVMRAFK